MLVVLVILILQGLPTVSVTQTISISARSSGKQFDGIGVVDGGGATSVLLKDYPEPWRTKIMEMVY